MRRTVGLALAIFLIATGATRAQRYLEGMGVTLRIDEAALTPSEATEYGAWKRLGMALGHFAEIVTKNERD